MASEDALKLIEQAAAEGWTKLDLSGMELDVLPPEIGKLEKLETLTLGKWDKRNNLETLPDEIAQLSNLTTLDFSFNQIQEIPVAIAQLSNLTTLQLSSNQIKEIPEAIAQLSNLTTLYLSRNQIKEIPEAITQLTNLSQLNLSNNQIKEISAAITQLSNLTSLDISGNNIKEIPEHICKLANLTQLSLGNNQIQISTLPSSIIQLSKLTRLELTNIGLEEISNEINSITNLEALFLGYNKIQKIPSSLVFLKNLKEFYLHANKITDISIITQMQRLEVLTIGGNKIQNIPKSIGNLKKLVRLNFSESQLSQIPDEIGLLSNLKELEIEKNKIKQLPETISQLTQLQTLQLHDNEITKIPREILRLYNLEKLWLSGNKINEIPWDLEKLQNLQYLYLCDNSLPISPEILESNLPEKIFYYLRQLKSGEVRPLNEAKLVLVGQGSVGKTSLIQRLINDAYNPNEPQTDGLNVENWQIHVNSKDISLNVWDFGGQEIYHATHQFFLTKRSLYLLVCNCRTSEEENRIEYWLKLIQTFGDASPVIIVGNKKDEQPFDINRKALREKYPNICNIIETSCPTREGITELSNEIYKQVAGLKEVYDLLPLPWFEVKEKLEAMTDDFITYNRYLGICYEHKIPEEKNQEQLIDLLHRLGLVLNFREHPILQNTNVLKPDWATEGIYTLLSDETLKTESKGIFTIADLSRILDPERYPTDKHCYLIELMKEFELCFDLDCKPVKYLIPGILPKDELNETNLRGDTLEFQYHYRVLPESIISRFIVKTHEKIHEQIWWRSGVMLAYREGTDICNIARIKADPEDKKIFIAISGKQETRRLFLGILRDVFNKIHSTFANPEITEWVPVPNYSKHPPLDYQELIGLEAMGDSTVNIGKLRLRLDLRQLLDGYESPQQRQQSRNEAARIDKQYNFYGEVKDPDFIGGSKMTGDQPNVNINADNIGIANMSGGKIESGAIVAGQYNEASSDLEDLLKLIALMKEAVQFFPQEQQEDITIDIDDIEAEVKKPKDKRRIPKIKKCLTTLATAGTVAIAGLSATNQATVQFTEFVDNASALANKFQIELPAQNQTLPPAP